MECVMVPESGGAFRLSYDVFDRLKNVLTTMPDDGAVTQELCELAVGAVPKGTRAILDIARSPNVALKARLFLVTAVVVCGDDDGQAEALILCKDIIYDPSHLKFIIDSATQIAAEVRRRLLVTPSPVSEAGPSPVPVPAVTISRLLDPVPAATSVAVVTGPTKFDPKPRFGNGELIGGLMDVLPSTAKGKIAARDAVVLMLDKMGLRLSPKDLSALAGSARSVLERQRDSRPGLRYKEVDGNFFYWSTLK